MKSIHDLIHHFHDPDLGILLVRLALAPVFIYSGLFKLGSMTDTIRFFHLLGFSPFLAYFVAWSEFLGGLAFLLGIFSRYAGILLDIIMIVAVKVTFGHGYSLATGGYQFGLALLFLSLAMVTFGSGKYSLAYLIRGKK